MTAGIGGGSVGDADRVPGPVAPPPAPAPDPDPDPDPESNRSLADRLLDGAVFGVLALDDRGLVRRANATARRLLPGVREAEVLPRSVASGLAGGTADGPAELELAGRALRARRQELPDGWVAWHVEDVTEHRRRLDHLLAERARSRFLATASRRLGLSLHPGRTARAVVELASSELADLAVVVLPVRGGVSRWYACDGDRVARSGRTDAADMPAELRDALAGIATGPRPMLAEDLAGQPWAAGAPAAAALLSLPGNGVPAGALVLLRHEVDPAAAPGVDQALTEEFAQRSGLALAAASLYAAQAGTAAVVKRSLQQPELPRVPGMVFGVAYRPAEEGLLIGGDFYDVHVGPDRSAMFVLGDVCGKGVHAAVSTGQLRQSVQALRRLHRDPVGLLQLLNETMLEAADPEADPGFATVVLGTATPLADGGLELELAGGGHLPPLVVRRAGVEEIGIGGMLVGAVPSARFASRTVRLAPGEACVLYTDGVSEARGGVDGCEVLGEQRLAGLLAGAHVMPAPAIAERVEQHTRRWLVSRAHDDIAVLVVQAPHAATAVNERVEPAAHRTVVAAQRTGVLGAAVYLSDPEVLTGYLGWPADLLDARGVGTDAARAVLAGFHAGLHDFPFAQECLRRGAARSSGRTHPGGGHRQGGHGMSTRSGVYGDPARGGPLRVHVRADAAHLVLVLVGDLTFGTTARLEEHVRAVAEETGPDLPADLVVDVEGLDFCDSAGLAALIGLQRRAARRGGTVTLAGVGATLRRVLRVTGAEILFTLRPAEPGTGAGSAGRAG
ncbi:SpoIIE family protein phosphatase [Pseudonocardia sp. RS010]|uniref:SpoIIE family protein phosphatase n=1 Tax=Pseudonocardia sp. RS010 TaxID=3385979 RepID=UPI0039A15461